MARTKIEDTPVYEYSPREEKKGIFGGWEPLGGFGRWRGSKGKTITRTDRHYSKSRLQRHFVINKIFPDVG